VLFSGEYRVDEVQVVAGGGDGGEAGVFGYGGGVSRV